MRIRDQVALITGASQGIGAACAHALALRGARLALTARSQDKLDAVARDCGVESVALAGDLVNPDDRRRVVEQTLARFGRIDILVNNAGAGLYANVTEDGLVPVRELFELNFFAALEMIQLVAPGMRERRSGAIVNVSSIAGQVTLPWMTLYSASKHALSSLTAGLRMELAADGVHAMTVCPVYVDTGFQSNAISGRPPSSLASRRRFAISAAECAEAMVRGLEREARTVVIPRVGWLLVAVARLFPGILESRLAAMGRKAS